MAKVEVKVVSDCGLDGLTFHLPSRTKPQFASDCDLSTIVRRFLKTGELPQLHHKPEISDATVVSDNLFDALEPAVKARQEFDQLPLEERNKYNNDPEAWVADLINNTKGTKNEEINLPASGKELSEGSVAPGKEGSSSVSSPSSDDSEV